MIEEQTAATGLLAIRHSGGLVGRYVADAGVLPGTMIMVPDGCYCVMIAGEKATATFGAGPHELDLMLFNRQPSGMLYTVSTGVETISWFPDDGDVRRTLSLRVLDPELFIEEVVVRGSAGRTDEVVGLLSLWFDANVPVAGEVFPSEQTSPEVDGFLASVGLDMVWSNEGAASAPPPPPPA